MLTLAVDSEVLIATQTYKLRHKDFLRQGPAWVLINDKEVRKIILNSYFQVKLIISDIFLVQNSQKLRIKYKTIRKFLGVTNDKKYSLEGIFFPWSICQFLLTNSVIFKKSCLQQNADKI